jgi:hypothetical protein
MDQDPRTAGPPVEDPDRQRTPEEIRADISQTREEVGDTVEALAAKTDVKAQAQHKVEEIKSNVRAKTPGGAQQGSRQIADKVRANPAPVAIASAALFGFLVAKLADRRR